MRETIEAGTYICLFVLDGAGNKYHVDESFWDEIDAAYHNWIERKIDRVLALTCSDGGPVLVAASRISELCLSSPEIRMRGREQSEALKAEGGFSAE